MTRVGVIACGALAVHVRRSHGGAAGTIDVHPLPALLHNRPERIAGEVEAALERLRGRYDELAVAYADCGTYGALDAVLDRDGHPAAGGRALLRRARRRRGAGRARSRSPAPTC